MGHGAKIWALLQRNFPEVPDVRFRFVPLPDDTAATYRPGLVTLDTSYRWASLIELLDVVAHEFVHALADIRGVTDTGPSGRHREGFRKLAKEIGLTVSHTRKLGFAYTRPSVGMLLTYGPEMIQWGDDRCWTPHGKLNKDGYKRVQVGDRLVFLHRAILGAQYLPAGYEVDHLCRVRSCFNPSHLAIVTHLENVLRKPSVSRTHCPHGHRLTAANTFQSKGGRVCRECHRLLEQKRRKQKKEALLSGV